MVSAFRDWFDEDERFTGDDENEGNLQIPDQPPLHDEDIMETDDRYDIELDGDDDEQLLEVPLGLVFRISCYAHTLQLLAKDAIGRNPKSQRVLKDVHGILNFFKKSNYWRARLSNVMGKELIKPAPTRWNSNFYVLKRLTEVLYYIFYILDWLHYSRMINNSNPY